MKTKMPNFLIAIFALIILIGCIVIATIGLKFDLDYSTNKSIELALGKTFDEKDIREITDEVFNSEKKNDDSSEKSDDNSSKDNNNDSTKETADNSSQDANSDSSKETADNSSENENKDSSKEKEDETEDNSSKTKKQKVKIETIEIFKDNVKIVTTDITEEQKNELVSKINEKYGTELKADDIKITENSHIRGRDIIKPYIVPFTIMTLFILLYQSIRFKKLNPLFVVLKSVLSIIMTEAVAVSVIACCRIPIGNYIDSLMLFLYVISLLCVNTKFENEIQD